ncbi:MAG: hypothetical protein HEP71_32155 [Roseivirga sp.]|nr:hypothetical protein [Roseivirga sp.]
MKSNLNFLLCGIVLLCASFSIKAQNTYQVAWTDILGIDIDTTTIIKQLALGTSWAGAASVNELQPSVDGWFEFTVVRPIGYNDYYIGFSTTNIDLSPNTIRYALRFKGNSEIDYFEGGTSRGTITTFNVGDTFRIAREGSDIVIYKNGTSVATYMREDDLSLIVDATLVGQYAAVGNVVASFDSGPGGTVITPLPVTTLEPPSTGVGDFFAVDWADLVGITVDSHTLKSDVSTAWNNSGAASTNRLGVGEDGWFEFEIVTGIAYSNFAIGFSTTNYDEDFSTIRHALRFKGNTQVEFLNGGNAPSYITSYHTGDKFRMGREGEEIVVYKNGTEVLRSSRGNDVSLIIDVALYNFAAAVGNVVASFGTTSLPDKITPGGISGPWAVLPGSTTDTYTTGAVAIQGATLPAGYSLAVGGEMIAEGVKVTLVENWPDYVFKPEYRLFSLEEIKAYIDQNGHLPGMPSAQEAEKEGVELLDMNKKLLEKVEELTLHLIRQNELLQKQQQEIEELKKKAKD